MNMAGRWEKLRSKISERKEKEFNFDLYRLAGMQNYPVSFLIRTVPVGIGACSEPEPENVIGVDLEYCPWNDITQGYEQKFRIVASDIVRWYCACATLLQRSHFILKH